MRLRKVARFGRFVPYLCFSAAFPWRHLGCVMGGCKRMGGGTRTELRTLQKISGPLEKGVCSGETSTFFTRNKEQGHQGGVENVPNDGGSKTTFCAGCHS